MLKREFKLVLDQSDVKLLKESIDNRIDWVDLWQAPEEKVEIMQRLHNIKQQLEIWEKILNTSETTEQLDLFHHAV